MIAMVLYFQVLHFQRSPILLAVGEPALREQRPFPQKFGDKENVRPVGALTWLGSVL